MNRPLLIYTSQSGRTEEKLLKALGEGIVNRPIEICHTADALERRLRRPVFDLAAAVLLAASHAELQRLISLRELLRDIKVILIAPDSHPETIVKGHLLKPRFLCECAGDLTEVAAVLQRMAVNKKQQERLPRRPGRQKGQEAKKASINALEEEQAL